MPDRSCAERAGPSAPPSDTRGDLRQLAPWPQFFASVHQSCEAAIAGGEKPVERFYTVGGHVVHFRFGGTALLPLITSALAHLEVSPPPSASLTLFLFDSASTAVRMPCVPSDEGRRVMRGNLFRLQSATEDVIAHLPPEAYSILDRVRNEAVLWIRDWRELTQQDIGSPLLRVLHWWAVGRGRQLVHAAGIGLDDGGVLLVGKGGAGKSVTSLGCLQSPLLYAGDDYCLVAGDPRPWVYSLYNSGKLNTTDVSRFPFLEPAVCDGCGSGTEKVLYFVHRQYPHKTTRGFPLKAILVLHRASEAGPRLERAPAAAALLALAPSTISQLPAHQERMLSNLGELVKRVPCYTFTPGPDSEAVARAIQDLLLAL